VIVTNRTGLPHHITIAIIGSFRQYYADVLEAIKCFESAHIRVVSPPKSQIRDMSRPFIRFVIDPEPDEMSDHQLQQKTLNRILSASCVYVVAPYGYIGRTTLLELGHVRERGVPTFFSAVPDDLPIHVQNSAVISAANLADLINRRGHTALTHGHRMPACYTKSS